MKPRIHVIYGQGELDITCSYSISGPQVLEEQPEYIKKLFERENINRVSIEYSTDIPDLKGFTIYTKMKDLN